PRAAQGHAGTARVDNAEVPGELATAAVERRGGRRGNDDVGHLRRRQILDDERLWNENWWWWRFGRRRRNDICDHLHFAEVVELRLLPGGERDLQDRVVV